MFLPEMLIRATNFPNSSEIPRSPWRSEALNGLFTLETLPLPPPFSAASAFSAAVTGKPDDDDATPLAVPLEVVPPPPPPGVAEEDPRSGMAAEAEEEM